MATIPYIDSGAQITADLMNVIWSEFDRRMDITMGGDGTGTGKSWLLFQDSPNASYISTITGKRFFFTSITTFGRSKDIAGVSSPNYNHATYTAAVAAASEYTTNDHFNKIVYLTGGGLTGTLLDDSLEAHKKVTVDATPESCWVWENGAVYPQRRHRFAVAEFIFEDPHGSAVTIPNTYDKYQYFRLHNLNPFSITVTFTAFPGQVDYAVTIPAYGCRCCQRRPGEQMQGGYNYFWKFMPDDPRSITTKPFGGNAPSQTMRVNNVWNPALIFEIIELFSERGQPGLADAAGLTSVRMIRDPHVIYTLGQALWGDFFGDPSSGSTILGDLLHHKGAVDYIYRNLAGPWNRVSGFFEGYSNLASLSAMGLTVVSGGGSVTLQGTLGGEFNDIVTPGTNLLFTTPGTVVTSAEVSAARTIRHKQPDAMDGANVLYNEMYLPADKVTSGAGAGEIPNVTGYLTPIFDADGNVSGSSSSTVSYTQYAVQGYTTSDETATLDPTADTVTSALTFNTFGRVALNGTNQDSAVAMLQNRRAVLTIFGPMFLWEQKYDFVASAYMGSAFTLREPTPGRPYAEIVSSKIVDHRYIVWGGYGFEPFPYRDKLTGAYNGTHGGFMNPRRTRAVNAFGAGPTHPNYAHEIYGPDGSDFTINAPLAREASSIRLLYVPSYVVPGGGYMPMWNSADGLHEYDQLTRLWDDGTYDSLRVNLQSGTPGTSYMPRVKMMRETYNTMASWVNSCVKARPFNWYDFWHYLPATSEKGPYRPVAATVYDNNLSTGGSAGSRGILGTTVRPINQYCSFESGSFEHHLFSTIGVPIKTDADLPASFLSALATTMPQYRFRGSYDVFVDAVTSLGGSNYQYKMHNTLNTVAQVSATTSSSYTTYKVGQHNAPDVFDAAPPSWPGPGSPDDDKLDVSGYLWVTISDVKTVAEAMGFKFIFEEQSIPLKYQELAAGGSGAYSTIVSSTPYYYETETTATPRTVGFYQNRPYGFNLITDAFFPLAYDSLRPRFVPTTSGADWKRDLQLFPVVVGDQQPGDVETYAIGASSAWFIFEFTDATTVLGQISGTTLNPAVYYKRAYMQQIAASAGLTVGSGAFSIPTPWFAPTTNTYSLDSLPGNARATFALGTTVIPLAVSGAYSGESFTPFSTGNNLIAPASGKAHEILPWRDIYADLS